MVYVRAYNVYTGHNEIIETLADGQEKLAEQHAREAQLGTLGHGHTVYVSHMGADVLPGEASDSLYGAAR